MKEYKLEDLRISKNHLDMVRQRADWFGGERPRAPRLIANLIHDLILFDALPVQIESVGDWWVILVAKDWLEKGTEETGKPLNSFFRITHFPASGKLAIRNEVLITAFASVAITATSKGIEWLVGLPEGEFFLPEILSAKCKNLKEGRIVAFIIDESLMA